MAHHHRPAEEGCAAASLPLPPMEDALSVSARPPSATSCLLPARSLRSTTVVSVPVAAQAQAQADDGGGGIRSLSFSKLFLSFRMARAPSSSLDYTIDQLDDAAGANNSDENKKNDEKLKQVSRSQSVPMGVRRFGGRVTTAAASRRVADSSSLLGAAAAFKLSLVVPAAAAPGEQTTAEADIAAEEAVCRICMVALSEVTAGAGREDETDGGVLKLECCCKGELALAHTACAVKWFGIKGNGTCDVCSQEVLNLPVILRHHPPSAPASAPASHHEQQQQQEQQGRRHHSSRVWRGTPILVVISMMAYFCFLEELLVGDHGTAALAISLPFACVLGLFSSLTTTKMVSRRYVWIYSAVQFLFIVLFTHLFYRYVRMQAVISIIVSTFAGFSVAICAHSALLLILRWRTRRAAASAATTGDEEQGRGASTEQPPAIGIEVVLPSPP